jgi:glycine oxidase
MVPRACEVNALVRAAVILNGPRGENGAVLGTGNRFWRDELEVDEQAVLDHGLGELDFRPDVLVVGGGIMGVATAQAVHDRALGSVQLIEASTLASGATGGSAGLLQPEPHHGSDPVFLVELGRLSLDLWRRLEAGVPGGVGLLELDWIGLAPQPQQFIADPPPTVRWLDPTQVGRLIPDLATPDEAAMIERQARVNPQRATARLARQLPRIATGTTATEARITGNKITAVATPVGTFRPGVVIFTTGTPPGLGGLDLAVPADRIKGHLLVTETTGIRLPGVVAPVAVPLANDRFLVGGTLDLDDHSPDVRDEVIAALRAQLTAALPTTSAVLTTHRWCCWRPHHPDGLPVIDRVPGVENAWFTSGHYRTGVLMAPATAELLVQWITNGRPPATAAPFTLARLTASPPGPGSDGGVDGTLDGRLGGDPAGADPPDS